MLKIWKLIRNTAKSLVKKLNRNFPEIYAENFV